MENNLEINLDLCIKCKTCQQVCGADVFGIDAQGFPFEKHPEVCSTCGHCISACPKSVIKYRDIGFKDAEELDPDIPSYNQLKNLISKRRSVRRYNEDPIPGEVINKILTNLKYTLTGHNAQELEYTILKDRKIIHSIGLSIGQRFKIAQLLIPFLPQKTKGNIRRLVERSEQSQTDPMKEPFLRYPHVLFIIHAKKSLEKFLQIADAGIASYNIILTAESLGLGTCWLGFHTIISNLFPKVKKLSKIPRNHKVLATIAMGYPKYKYRRKCARNPLKINIYD
jgi:nitroreductase/NAD-dependent dihydropyrimidine dehydrogenase PreA subunit